MGCCKTQLRWRGNRLLTHQQNLLDALKLPYLVSGPQGIQDRSGFSDKADEQYNSAMQKTALCKEPVNESEGPLTGIASCLMSRPQCAMLFIPIDMPLLSAAVLENLLHHARSDSSRYYDNFPLPCLVANTFEHRQTAIALSQAPGRRRSVSHFLKTIGAQSIPSIEHRKVLASQANTPEEWRRLKTNMDCND